MKFDKVVIFAPEPQSSTLGRPTSARGETRSTQLANAVEVGVDVMEQNVTSFVESVSTMIDAAEKAVVGEVNLDTVEISVQVGTDGKVGFMGIGLGANATSSMKIVFKRRTRAN